MIISIPPGWDASPSQVTPSISPVYPFILLGGERHSESKVSCPRTQHNDPARARTRTGPPRLPLIIYSVYTIIRDQLVLLAITQYIIQTCPGVSSFNTSYCDDTNIMIGTMSPED